MVIQNQGIENIRDIGKGEAQYRKYERLKFGGCQMYGRSND
jgi:hypothetical protein